MNNTLSNFKFNDLLPSSVKDDPKFIAASACLDKLFENFDDRVKLMLIYSRIDELTESEIDDLAWQWNIGYFEGYFLVTSLEEKKRLVKHAIQVHWHKGTLWALRSVPQFLGMPTFTIEWFESDLIGSEMEPYEFDFAIDTGVRGASPTIQSDVMNLINNLKNARSYLRHIILMISWRLNIRYGIIGHGLQIGKVRPKHWPGGTARIKYGIGVAEHSAIAARVLPKVWTGGTIKIGYRKVAGEYSATTARVLPKAWTGGTVKIKYTMVISGHMVMGNSVRPKIIAINIAIALKTKRTPGYYFAVKTKVLPRVNTRIETSVKYRVAVGSYSAATVRINPKIRGGNDILIKNKTCVGAHSATFGRVNPARYAV